MRTPESWTAADRAFMALALEQANAARGRVAPNPAVGAVVVRGGQVVSTGATQPPPGPHAEVVALAAAGEAAHGADLYVTLEPCSHYGRTPPCANAVIAAGVHRVVAAMRDPNPLVGGRGIERLRAAGVQVEVGLLAEEAAEVIAGFACRVASGRPLVTAKYAMTLDGRLATRTGDARWISAPESRHHAHMLRDRVDAIVVGIGTVLADDPQLTTRLPVEEAGYGGPHHPLRVVLDTVARIPLSARLLSPETPGRTLVLTGPDAPAGRVAALYDAGAEVVALPASDGRLSPAAVLDLLGKRGINELLIEGGGQIHGAFFDARLVDRVCIYVAPIIVGGDASTSPVGGLGVATLPEAARVVARRVRALGADLCIEGCVRYRERANDV